MIIFDAMALFSQLKSVELDHKMQMTAINPVIISRRCLSKCRSGLLNEIDNWLSAERLSISCSFFFSHMHAVIAHVTQLPFSLHTHAFSYHNNYVLQAHTTVFVYKKATYWAACAVLDINSVSYGIKTPTCFSNIKQQPDKRYMFTLGSKTDCRVSLYLLLSLMARTLQHLCMFVFSSDEKL